MEKKIVIEQLKKYLVTEFKTDDKDSKKKFLSIVEGLTEDDISFGPLPTFFYGYLQCNSTGVGESSFGNTETRRTVARDYRTDELLFIDGHEDTCRKGLQLFLLKSGQTVVYYKKSEAETIAKRQGFEIHRQYFSDLNITLRDHRLNRYQLHYTKEPFTLPIRAIFGKTKQDEKFVLGYVYTKNETEHIVFEIQEPPKAEKSKLSTGCLLGLLGLVFPPLWIGLLFYELVKAQKKRMIG